MTYPVYYARGDSSSANNAALNAQGTTTTPVTTLEFRPTDGGDAILEYNGGLPDPDTVVFVDGVEMTFTLEFSGTLPGTNKLKNVNGEDLRGTEITVITTEDGQRFFFGSDGTLSSATMADFPNGAHAIGNVDTTTSVAVCFGKGTRIATPVGDRLVESLEPGDLVLNHLGQQVPVLWIAKRYISNGELQSTPALAPVKIKAGSLGPNLPDGDLVLSKQHRILLSHPDHSLTFGCPDILAPATYLPPEIAPVQTPKGGVTYYHLLFNCHEIVISNGLMSESFQPGIVSINGLSLAVRHSFVTRFDANSRSRFFNRPDAAYSVLKFEAPLIRAFARPLDFTPQDYSGSISPCALSA